MCEAGNSSLTGRNALSSSGRTHLDDDWIGSLKAVAQVHALRTVPVRGDLIPIYVTPNDVRETSS